MLMQVCDVYKGSKDVRKVRIQVSLVAQEMVRESDVDLFLEIKDLSPRARELLVAGIRRLIKPPAERKADASPPAR